MENLSKVSPSVVIQKRMLRSAMHERLAKISVERRQEAALMAYERLSALLEGCHHVLSFVSLAEEIDLSPLNEALSLCHALCLPLVAGERLRLFVVSNPVCDLAKGCWGIWEPIAERCEEVFPSEIDAVIVPGLAFDGCCHRLGRGKGYYDRLLATLSPTALTYGVGFREQKVSSPLPIEPHDRPLSSIFLF